eukprot:6876655-Prymnesium_polylepis.1
MTGLLGPLSAWRALVRGHAIGRGVHDEDAARPCRGDDALYGGRQLSYPRGRARAPVALPHVADQQGHGRGRPLRVVRPAVAAELEGEHRLDQTWWSV